MEKETKIKITEMVRQGVGKTKIAAELNISVNTVKSFIKRSGIKPNAAGDKKGFCLYCGLPVVSLPHKKEKKFCSAVCRMRWWNERPEKVNRKAYYTLTCKNCGVVFVSYGNDHRGFCCRKCYADYRRKKND